jgi:hypothetical protein
VSAHPKATRTNDAAKYGKAECQRTLAIVSCVSLAGDEEKMIQKNKT